MTTKCKSSQSVKFLHVNFFISRLQTKLELILLLGNITLSLDKNHLFPLYFICIICAVNVTIIRDTQHSGKQETQLGLNEMQHLQAQSVPLINMTTLAANSVSVFRDR